jgi:hypothetical protein
MLDRTRKSILGQLILLRELLNRERWWLFVVANPPKKLGPNFGQEVRGR